MQAVLLFGSNMWVENPPHGLEPGGVSVQGGQTDYREAPPVASECKLGSSPIGDGDKGDGLCGGGGVLSEGSEYGRTLYCSATDSGTLRVDGTDATDVG